MSLCKGERQRFTLGVDIGGTKILLLISDSTGRIICRKRVKSTGDLRTICETIDGFLKKAKIEKDSIVGMGVGVPGDVNSVDGIVRSSIQMGWSNVNIKKYMEEWYHFPIHINNDVNLAALGERWMGSGANSDHLVYISIGTGVGGAIIANGQLLEGITYSAGEFGYIVDKDDLRKGLTNEVDKFGSLERKISGNALNEKAHAIGLTAKELFVEYTRGNKEAIHIVDAFSKELSIVIANLTSILNPEYVIIGGGVSESMECISDTIINYVRELTIFPTKIRLSTLGGDAGAFGCIYYVFYKGGKKER